MWSLAWGPPSGGGPHRRPRNWSPARGPPTGTPAYGTVRGVKPLQGATRVSGMRPGRSGGPGAAGHPTGAAADGHPGGRLAIRSKPPAPQSAATSPRLTGPSEGSIRTGQTFSSAVSVTGS